MLCFAFNLINIYLLCKFLQSFSHHSSLVSLAVAKKYIKTIIIKEVLLHGYVGYMLSMLAFLLCTESEAICFTNDTFYMRKILWLLQLYIKEQFCVFTYMINMVHTENKRIIHKNHVRKWRHKHEIIYLFSFAVILLCIFYGPWLI